MLSSHIFASLSLAVSLQRSFCVFQLFLLALNKANYIRSPELAHSHSEIFEKPDWDFSLSLVDCWRSIEFFCFAYFASHSITCLAFRITHNLYVWRTDLGIRLTQVQLLEFKPVEGCSRAYTTWICACRVCVMKSKKAEHEESALH